jgi:hypothetical protein
LGEGAGSGLVGRPKIRLVSAGVRFFCRIGRVGGIKLSRSHFCVRYYSGKVLKKWYLCTEREAAPSAHLKGAATAANITAGCIATCDRPDNARGGVKSLKRR